MTKNEKHPKQDESPAKGATSKKNAGFARKKSNNKIWDTT